MLFSISLTSLVAALLLGANSVYTSPVDLVKRAACNKDSYLAFRLYAVPVDDPTSEGELVKLIDSEPRTIDAIEALTVCPVNWCGNVPAYFELKDRVLSALVYTDLGEYTVVNKPVVANSTVNVVPSDVYLQRSPGSDDGLPGYLSVNGSAEEFSWCSDIPPNVKSVRRDIYYQPASGVPNRYCTKVHLVMQSIGIIEEPIPETEV
ncbi:hypothetical protein M408DRAFT_314513 [Serendipita vermifera MAFF 305830]|uniref:Uncharacterized protein n=1 Tax=Serendipita vermifera MAFF 305830 TaxID=933852 RepID=A0A0C3B104_SERVB|nr:hypothetical protein M408DRAFT_314513 [Serendipita vermifera MAFF 305830]